MGAGPPSWHLSSGLGEGRRTSPPSWHLSSGLGGEEDLTTQLAPKQWTGRVRRVGGVRTGTGCPSKWAGMGTGLGWVWEINRYHVTWWVLG
jgi:hypothetical protein